MVNLTSDNRDYNGLIGAVLRDADMTIMGEIVGIDTSVDGYGHQSSFILTDNGVRINARSLDLGVAIDTRTVLVSMIDPATIVRDEAKDLIKFVERDDDDMIALNRRIRESAKPKAKSKAIPFLSGVSEILEG